MTNAQKVGIAAVVATALAALIHAVVSAKVRPDITVGPITWDPE